MNSYLSSKPERFSFITFLLTTLITLYFIFIGVDLSFSQSSTLVLHLSAELISIFVFISVVLVVFLGFAPKASRQANVIIFGFTFVGLTDFIHALSYAGMPELISPASTEKGIFFWFVARTAELLTFAILALQLKFKGSKFIWLLFSLAMTLLSLMAGALYLDQFPVTYIEGEGVTQFKSGYEIMLGCGFLVMSVIFFQKKKSQLLTRNLYFAVSAYCMALCSFTLIYYLTPSDLNMVWAHLLKIISAIVLYKAVFIEELARPYSVVQKARQLAQTRQRELDTILNNMPLGVIRISPDLKLIYINEFVASVSPYLKDFQPGRLFTQAFPSVMVAQYLPFINKALQGSNQSFSYQYPTEKGEVLHRDCLILPESKDGKAIDSLLCLIEDTTEKLKATQAKQEAITKMQELSYALDQHASVAITDNRGIILSANNKFCEISKYSREELIGNTHNILNSQYHSPTFFRNMWETIQQGEVWNGEVCNKAKDGSLYWVRSTIVPLLDENKKPHRYIAIRADITARKQVEKKLHTMEMYDELTKLPNRHYFSSMLNKLKQESNISPESSQESYHGLIFIDLDNFKIINDTLSHEDGDAVLVEVANRLESILQPSQHAARLGSDEFVIFLTSLSEDKEKATVLTQQFAENVKTLLCNPYSLKNDNDAVITASIGITLFNHSQVDFSEIMKQADIAMYQSKGSGKNQVSFFDPTLQATIENRTKLTKALNKAMPNKEFRLNYQPIYNQQGGLVGFEALIRWYSETLGQVFPDQFIPLIEENNMIIPVGKWVMETACQKLNEWADNDQLNHLTIAVNVSAVQFQQADFTQTVAETIKQYQINPACLKLEITEGVMLMGLSAITERMLELKALGVTLLLDDFGTGYSSLSYLTRFPIDILKIDKQFVDKMLTSKQDEAVVRSIMSLTQGLQMQVIAEGVETEEQFNYLNTLNCEYYQGYYFSRPIELNSNSTVETLLIADKITS